MHLRLAFAVAAHLEPEILIVDEVLAVGDAAFQRKCLGKMGEVVGRGADGAARQPQHVRDHVARRPLPLARPGARARAGRPDADRRRLPLRRRRLGAAGVRRPLRPEAPRGRARRRRARRSSSTGSGSSTTEGKPSDVFFEGDPLTIELGLESTIDSSRLEALCFVSLARGDPRLHAHVGPARRRPPPRLRGAQGHDPTEPATHRPVHARPLRAHGAAAGLPASARRRSRWSSRASPAATRAACGTTSGSSAWSRSGASCGRGRRTESEVGLDPADDSRPRRPRAGTRAPRSAVLPRRSCGAARRRGTRQRRAPRSPRRCCRAARSRRARSPASPAPCSRARRGRSRATTRAGSACARRRSRGCCCCRAGRPSPPAAPRRCRRRSRGSQRAGCSSARATGSEKRPAPYRCTS